MVYKANWTCDYCGSAGYKKFMVGSLENIFYFPAMYLQNMLFKLSIKDIHLRKSASISYNFVLLNFDFGSMYRMEQGTDTHMDFSYRINDATVMEH